MHSQGKHSIGCLYYLLAKMVLEMRGSISAANPWDVVVDLFFYREPEETREHGEEDAMEDFQVCVFDLRKALLQVSASLVESEMPHHRSSTGQLISPSPLFASVGSARARRQHGQLERARRGDRAGRFWQR